MDSVDIPTGDLITQLKLELLATDKPKQSQNFVEITEENATEFILQRSATLAQNAMCAMDDIGATVTATGDPDQISAYAELINATTGALEAINKIVITNKKIKGSLDIKKLELEGKKELQQEEHKHALKASREEVLKMMFDNAIEAEIVDTSSTNSKGSGS